MHNLGVCSVLYVLVEIRLAPPLTLSNTALTDYHPDTTHSSLGHTWRGFPGLLEF